MNDNYVTRAELKEVIEAFGERMEKNLALRDEKIERVMTERDERLIKEMSKIFAEKMSKIMTEQTDRLLKSLSFYEKMTEKHENNFQDIKKSIK